ncbi:MAG: hypothetical protein GY800_00425 [Planctomycetes bacterium]|nr:hypothetical protein [Planctomycetota bacterium]
MQRTIGMCVAVSLIAFFCLFISVSAADEGGVGQMNLTGLQKFLGENEGKVVLMNFWSPF